MDANEARQLVQDVIKSILDNESIQKTLHKLARVISYLISEQEERQKLIDLMTELKGELQGSNKEVGLLHRVAMIEKHQEKQSKFMLGIQSSMLIFIILKVFDLLHK